MAVVQAWDFGARPGIDCTAALKNALAAAGVGGRVELPYDNPGDYYVQPHAPGYVALSLISGQTVRGAPGVVLASMPNGIAGQIIGVRNASGQPIKDVRLDSVIVRNSLAYDGQKAAAISFGGSANVPGSSVENIEVLNCVVQGTAGGDAISFGNFTKGVRVIGGHFYSYARHGICFAGSGADRVGFSVAGAEVGPATQAYKAIQVEAASPGISNLTISDCRVEDTINSNNGPNTYVMRCVVLGGSIQLVNSPNSAIENCTVDFQRRANSSERAILLLEDCHDTRIFNNIVLNRVPVNPVDAKPAVVMSKSARTILGGTKILNPPGTVGIQWPLDGSGIDAGGNVVVEVAL